MGQQSAQKDILVRAGLRWLQGGPKWTPKLTPKGPQMDPKRSQDGPNVTLDVAAVALVAVVAVAPVVVV